MSDPNFSFHRLAEFARTGDRSTAPDELAALESERNQPATGEVLLAVVVTPRGIPCKVPLDPEFRRAVAMGLVPGMGSVAEPRA